MESTPELKGIGNTPLVPLIKVPKHSDLKCQIHAKLEFRNPNRTIYDRLALALINTAESAYIVKQGSTLVFGPDPEFCFALISICNSRGYKLIALVPEISAVAPRLMNDLKKFGATILHIAKPSSENKVEEKAGEVLETQEITALGQAAWAKAKNLAETEGAINLMDIVFNQSDIFDSEVDRFIQEIVSSGIVPNVFVGEADHYGILRRISEKLPEKFKACQVFGVNSGVYSIAHKATDFNRPCAQLSPSDRNDMVTILERGAFRLARDLNKKEDLYCGERGGAVVAGALKILKDQFPKENQDPNFVVICSLPDSLEHSHGKFLNVEFMRGKGYMPEAEFNSLYWWYFLGVGNITFNTFPSLGADVKVEKAAKILESHPRLLVWAKNDHSRNLENVLGILTPDVMKLIEVNQKRDEEGKSGGGIGPASSLLDCSKFLHEFGTLDCRGKLGELDKLIEINPYAIIYNDVLEFSGEAETPNQFKTPMALVSITEINEWIYSVEEHHRKQYGWEPGVGFMKENYPETAEAQQDHHLDPNAN